MADDLSAQGSGLRARQTKRSPHAPGTPKPAVNLRVDIVFLAKGLEEAGSLSVGKEVVFLSARRVGDMQVPYNVLILSALFWGQSLRHRCSVSLLNKSSLSLSTVNELP